MKRHRLDPFSLVLGATFTGMGLLFLFGTVEARSVDLRWVWPLPLVVLGVLIIVTAARGLWQPAPTETPSDPPSSTTAPDDPETVVFSREE
jgi:hypothetical protein